MKMKWVTVLASALAIFSASTAAPASPVCRPLVVPTTVPLLSSGAGYWNYTLAQGQLGGGSSDDAAQLELFSSATGSFNLGSGVDADYATCNQCIMLHQDVTGTSAAKTFFQDSGLLTLSTAPDANAPAMTDTLPISLSNLRLVEVLVDPSTFHTTPVAGGECYLGVGDLIFTDGFDGPPTVCVPEPQTTTCSPDTGIPRCGIVLNNCGLSVNCGSGYCSADGGTCNAGTCACPTNAYLCGFRPYCELQQAINPCTHEIFHCDSCPPGGGRMPAQLKSTGQLLWAPHESL